MGAVEFFCEAEGASAKDAFHQAVEEAQWENGHEGYSGTIAEKNTFKLVHVAEGADPWKTAETMLYDQGKFDDKWGPAGCMVVRHPDNGKLGKYLFFGYASS